MKKFEGFPARMEYTAIPNIFFSKLLPQIDDMAELKMTLQVIAKLYRKKGSPRFVSYQELATDEVLMNALKAKGEGTEQALQKALEASISRGTLLQIDLEKDDTNESVYLLNTPGNRELIEKIESGEITLPGVKTTGRKYPTGEELPDIFTLYEENIAPRRIRLHQQVAQALEEVYANRLQEHAAELAEHFSYSSEAADLTRAVELLAPLADHDAAARLGLALARREAGELRGAARHLYAVYSSQPGTLMGVWASDVLAEMLGRRVGPGPVAARMETLIASRVCLSLSSGHSPTCWARPGVTTRLATTDKR